MDPADPQGDRLALQQLESRLRREVGDMVKVLVADVPVFFRRTIKDVFERSPRADELDDAALKALKTQTQAESERLAKAMQDQLSPFEVWGWEQGPVPEAPDDLHDHPGIGAILGQVETALEALLEAHGIPKADLGSDGRYRLPAYFVAGHFMKSLVANYWRALADYHQLSARLREDSHADERERRRKRWESV